MMSVKVEMEFTDKQISGLLCTAFEGGYSTWCTQIDYELPEGIDFVEFRKGGARQYKDENGKEDYFHWAELVPLVEGCALTMRDAIDKDKPYRITREDIEKGMRIFAKDHTRHFSDFINENDDAITGDVFLQCVVLGEAPYG